MKGSLALVAFTILCVTPVWADITSPPPTLQGLPSTHVWSITGVRASELASSQGGHSTMIVCTNTHTESTLVSVEVFGHSGFLFNNADADALEVGPGRTVSWITHAVAGQSTHRFLGIIITDGLLAGSARVLTTLNPKLADRILCAASVHARSTFDINFSLPVFRKSGQQGN
jgi:hypothetical protein